ncbi:MAG: SDR family oxidoreductase [Planctomycetota bacterium]|jgi:dTDP-4-dehydrorhamnose reductase|nr:SDR family oxidoreductase [Planctomycetota bacterium]
MKILVTGGTGLLGSRIAREAARFADVVPAGHRASGKGGASVALDIENADEVRRTIVDGGFTHVVHSAAIRDPEECLADPARAYRVNAVAVEYIAAACREAGATLVHVSTDYVFPGTTPPYREECRPQPINVYGRTKLAGEFAARAVDGCLVTRVPALWSADPEDARSPVKGFVEKLRAGKALPVENTLVRHFTLADDAAVGIAFCVEKKLSGVIHIAAGESQTKADFVRAVARHFGCDPGLVVDAGVSGGGDRRPKDSTLDTSLYRSHGGPHIRGMGEVFADLAAGA